MTLLPFLNPYRLLREYPFSLLNAHLVDYPTPANFNYSWGFGSLAGLLLLTQTVSGIFLAMHYTPHILYAFDSLEHIMRDVSYGWLLRYSHATGASMFFIVVYVHIARGLYYGSYALPRERVWSIGVIMFVLMMAIAFMGYVLPWGQMSFWGATVITNLFTAVPFIGETVAYWLWGGFSVDNATLNRFFSLHYLLPFVLFGFVILHLAILHFDGSGNPVGLRSAFSLPFYPYFYVKDLFGFLVLSCFFSLFVFFYPNYLGHPDNYIEANALVTPVHIVPEWYFLPFYAILRSIPSKLGGVIAMGAAVALLWFLPLLGEGAARSGIFRYAFRVFFWLAALNVVLLGWLGACPVEAPFIQVGQLATFVYFFAFLIILPICSRVDSELAHTESENYVYYDYR
jgi:quinol-cytochrome oxidoreductase complex cytochrome b subunit